MKPNLIEQQLLLDMLLHYPVVFEGKS